MGGVIMGRGRGVGKTVGFLKGGKGTEGIVSVSGSRFDEMKRVGNGTAMGVFRVDASFLPFLLVSRGALASIDWT